MKDDDMKESEKSDSQSRFASYATDEGLSESSKEHQADIDTLINMFNSREKKNNTIGGGRENNDEQHVESDLEKFVTDVADSGGGSSNNDLPFHQQNNNQPTPTVESGQAQTDHDIEVPLQDEELSHVLVHSQSDDTNSDAICRRLLYRQDSVQNILCINASSQMTERIDACFGQNTNHTGKTGIINFGMGQNTTPTSSVISGSSAVDSMVVRNISNPSDFARLGITVSRLIQEWKEKTRHPTGICFHSLTPLLRRAETQTLFEFLLGLIQNLGTNRLSAHYHLDPEAQDDQTNKTLNPLFNSIIRISDQGQIEVLSTQ